MSVSGAAGSRILPSVRLALFGTWIRPRASALGVFPAAAIFFCLRSQAACTSNPAFVATAGSR